MLEDVNSVLDHISKIADQQRHLDAWIRFLSFLPRDEYAMRLRLFVKWERERLRWIDSDAARMNRQFRQILTELCRLFSRRGVHRWLLRHWRRYIRVADRLADMEDRWDDQWLRLVTASFAVVDLFDEEEDEYPDMRKWIRLFEVLVYDQGLHLGDKLHGSLDEFVRGSPNLDSARQLVFADYQI